MANSFEITEITTNSVTVEISLDGNSSITNNGHTLIRISYRKSTVTEVTNVDYAGVGNVTSYTRTITGLQEDTDYVINVAYKYDAEGPYDYKGAVYIGSQSFTTEANEDSGGSDDDDETPKAYIYATKDGGKTYAWYPATPYIYTNGKWNKATPYIYSGGWK